MKNNLPKKTTTQAVQPGVASQKTPKKATATKSAKTNGKSAAATIAATAKPAAAAKRATATKPATAAKSATPKAKATVAKSKATAAKSKATAATKSASKTKKSPRANGKATKLAPVTTFVAQVEIGWGNSLYLRGEGAPELSWERGILMKYEDGCWIYSTTGAKAPVAFKFLINDHNWAEGHNQHVEPGSTSISTPHFHY